MKENRQSKEYRSPQIWLIGLDESDKVFIAASGTSDTANGINPMTIGTESEW